jgi:pimeloyl-ACP methyl ester carboxylesterase
VYKRQEVAAGYWRAFQTTDAEIGLIGLTRDSANNRLTNDQIGSIAVPVGLIWGERDTLTPLEQSARLQALLRGARLTVIAGAGHQPMEERPEDFNPALLALLSF